MRIGKEMTKHSKSQLNKINGKANANLDGSAATDGKQQEPAAVNGINAESLNEFYAAISTDLNYTPPLSLSKHRCKPH